MGFRTILEADCYSASVIYGWCVIAYERILVLYEVQMPRIRDLFVNKALRLIEQEDAHGFLPP